MNRLDAVIAELQSAKDEAITRFAAEANMPVVDFLRHFRVIVETSTEDLKTVSFRVEPRE